MLQRVIDFGMFFFWKKAALQEGNSEARLPKKFCRFVRRA